MTDDELRAWWPELGVVVSELRRTGSPDLADNLADAVRAASMSSEILGGVGSLLNRNRVLRSGLSTAGAAAWKAVMRDVYRTFPGLRLRDGFQNVLVILGLKRS